jgi:hypothetical protein
MRRLNGTGRHRSLRRRAAVAALALVPACAIGSRSGPGHGPSPLGSFVIAGPTLGPRTVAPTSCAAGEHQMFLGVDLVDEHARIVTRLIVDPATGPLVRAFQAASPFDATVLFQRSECRVFHFSLDSTGWRIDHVDELRMSLELDCQLPSGDSIVGTASAPGCS